MKKAIPFLYCVCGPKKSYKNIFRIYAKKRAMNKGRTKETSKFRVGMARLACWKPHEPWWSTYHNITSILYPVCSLFLLDMRVQKSLSKVASLYYETSESISSSTPTYYFRRDLSLILK